MGVENETKPTTTASAAPRGPARLATIPIEDLAPDPRNPRDNTDAVEGVARSIARFGFGAPIVARPVDPYDEADEAARAAGTPLVVMAGHTRLAAARSLGWPTVPVAVLDLDAATGAAYLLADNRLGERATWDDEALAALLRDLEGEGVDLDGLGWSPVDLDALLGDAPDPLDPAGAGDADEADSRTATTHLGEGDEARTYHAPVVVHGDCLAYLASLDEESVDAIVTDPPYGLGFMGKAWDAPDMAWTERWARECLRVIKPGGHIVAFGAARTLHRITGALEDAGWEIRDVINWLTWQGFPKSMDVSKAIDRHLGKADERPVVGERWYTLQAFDDPQFVAQGSVVRTMQGSAPRVPATVTTAATPDAARWEGWGTALKPCAEPAVLARKPLEGTVASTVLLHGTGALHIDACRHAPGDPMWPGPDTPGGWADAPGVGSKGTTLSPDGALMERGRWPGNIVVVPKVGPRERDLGTDGLPHRTAGEVTDRAEGSDGLNSPRAGAGRGEGARNHHPTVKPLRLMRWLVRLVTPPGGVVLDTFGGSGTTGMAACAEGFRAVLVERDPDYVALARARCAWAYARLADDDAGALEVDDEPCPDDLPPEPAEDEATDG